MQHDIEEKMKNNPSSSPTILKVQYLEVTGVIFAKKFGFIVIYPSSKQKLTVIPPTSNRTLKVKRLCCSGQMMLWDETDQGHIRAVVVVGPHPLRGKVLKLFNAGPIILGQTTCSEPCD